MSRTSAGSLPCQGSEGETCFGSRCMFCAASTPLSSHLQSFVTPICADNSVAPQLLLDFVPNHMAVDHPWTKERPELLMQGSENSVKREPQNFFKVLIAVVSTLLLIIG